MKKTENYRINNSFFCLILTFLVLVEQDEECDSGTFNSDSSQCCRDCMLNQKVQKPDRADTFAAECDDKNPSQHQCCNNCQFRENTFICREKTECRQERA